MNKLLFLDVETTGIDPVNCSIIQFAGFIEVPGRKNSEFSINIKPRLGAKIEKSALECIGKTIAQLKSEPGRLMPHEAKKSIESWFKRFIDKWNPSDKLVPIAYNGNFDLMFLSELWRQSGDKFIGSYINRNLLVDPLARIRWGIQMGEIPILQKLNLSAVCNHYDIKLDNAHDAMADTKATRELFWRLAKTFHNKLGNEYG